MEYEINISLNGKHFFATSPRSLRGDASAMEVYNELVKKFPKSEDWRISLYRKQNSSELVLENQ